MNIVLISNYNYSKYLADCIESVRSQSLAPDRIIVVDDGSTDGSGAIIEALAHEDDRIVPVFKANGGQLSCFNAAAGLVADADLVFLLDADDQYPVDYMARMCGHVDAAYDFFFCDVARTDRLTSTPAPSALFSDLPDHGIPASASLTYRMRAWIGAPTSALVLRGSLFKKILPYADEASWRTRADDVLIFASSILGARKVYVPSLAVSYRIHESNNYFHSAGQTRQQRAQRAQALQRLYVEMRRRARWSSGAPLSRVLREYFAIRPEIRSRFHLGPPLSFGTRLALSALK